MRKNKWKKPELIQLVRGKAEEAILSSCKLSTFPTGNPTGTKAQCWEDDCQKCYDTFAS